MMAILEAIHSVVHSKGEEPLCITDGPVKIVFLSKGPIVLVAVSRRKEAVKWILKQLEYLYHHVGCLEERWDVCVGTVFGDGGTAEGTKAESRTGYSSSAEGQLSNH